MLVTWVFFCTRAQGPWHWAKFLGWKKQKEKETTLETEGKTNVDQTVAAKEIQEVEEKQSEAK